MLVHIARYYLPSWWIVPGWMSNSSMFALSDLVCSRAILILYSISISIIKYGLRQLGLLPDQIQNLIN